MKKFLLVIFIAMALAFELYGIVNNFMTEDVKEVDHIKETTILVYEE